MTTGLKSSTVLSAKSEVPEIGVYPGVPEQDYFGWPAVSNSQLTPLLKSPAHCLYSKQHPKPPTDAMTLGSAVDCLVFNPTLWNERFAVADKCFAQTKKGEQCSKNGITRWNSEEPFESTRWYCGIHAPSDINVSRLGVVSEVGRADFKRDLVTTLSEDQSSTAYAMAKAVHDHPGASVLLNACEETQLSLVWRENTLLCKGRLDGLSTQLKTIIDLKKCQDASPEGFAKSIATYGYHRQGAMYLRGATFHGIDVKNFVIIAVESEPPHAVALYTLTERPWLGAGRPQAYGLSPVEYGNHQLLRLLDKYEQCERLNHWPGYSDKPEPISLPKWAEYAIERE